MKQEKDIDKKSLKAYLDEEIQARQEQITFYEGKNATSFSEDLAEVAKEEIVVLKALKKNLNYAYISDHEEEQEDVYMQQIFEQLLMEYDDDDE